MQWIKTHLTVVICGALSLVSVVMLVLGILLPDTQEVMASDKGVYNDLQRYIRNPVNSRVLEQERKYQEDVARRLEAFMAGEAKGGDHQPLLPHVFPEPDAEHQNAPFQFRAEYERKQQELLDMLRAKGRPTSAEIEEYTQQLEEHETRVRQDGTGPSADDSVRPSARQQSQSGKAAGRRRDMSWRYPRKSVIGAETASGLYEELTPEERVKKNPEAALSVRRAREIYCYATIDSLQADPGVTLARTQPTPVAMWQAQVSLWIQEDVISALARLNNEVAEQLPEGKRWVGNLPVKHLEYIALGDYVPPLNASSGRGVSRQHVRGSGSGGAREGPPPGMPRDVFTERGSSESADVIQFALGLVIEARSLLKVIDAISGAGFYTPLLVTYEAAKMDPSLTDYIYGSTPVIRVRLEYEVSLLRSRYEQWMPNDIKDALGIKY